MNEPVILGAARTPLGSYGGGLKNVPAPELAGIVIRELLARTKIPPSDVDEVIMGNVLGAGLGQNPARQAAARAGIPFSSSALTLDMVCGSGLRAVCCAAESVSLGNRTVVVAGGTENMSRAPYIVPREEISQRPMSSVKYDGLRCAFAGVSMGVFAESLARAYSLTREEQDSYALEAHRKTAASVDSGLFERETVPVKRRDGGIVSRDECPRRNCSMEELSSLRPSFMKGGTVTAGNATPLADGAAALIVSSAAYAALHNIKPLAFISSWCTAGLEPENVFLATVAAVRKLMNKTGLRNEDIDVFEINDSFAVQALVCRKELELDPKKVNIRGGTLSLGHPLGSSGARILVTLLHIMTDLEMRRGLAAICLGGGNAVALLVERSL